MCKVVINLASSVPASVERFINSMSASLLQVQNTVKLSSQVNGLEGRRRPVVPFKPKEPSRISHHGIRPVYRLAFLDGISEWRAVRSPKCRAKYIIQYLHSHGGGGVQTCEDSAACRKSICRKRWPCFHPLELFSTRKKAQLQGSIAGAAS